VYKGETMEQFIIFFRDVKENLKDLLIKEKMHYYVKVKAYKCAQKEDKIEFDVFFGRLPAYDEQGHEFTLNWQATSMKNVGYKFYTDSNELSMITRNTKLPVYDNKKRASSTFASNLYPVNSAIMIEDPVKGIQMMVLNDRAQGGTAY